MLFIIANVCFGAALVFYNAFLPEITTEDQADKVSSRGFAYGYLGGAILLALNLLLVLSAEQTGDLDRSRGASVVVVGGRLVGRVCALSRFSLLRSRPSKKKLPPGKGYHRRRFFGDLSDFQRTAATCRSRCVT